MITPNSQNHIPPSKALIWILCCLLSLHSYATGITKGKEPDWVKIQTYDAAAAVQDKKLEQGYFYLLVDNQANVALGQAYEHYVRKIVSDAGVQNSTRISLSYNKSYQTITFHRIDIIRDGKVINRLDLSKFKKMERQSELANNQYNDEVSSMMLLEDIRVGDIIDESYTTSGSNPILENKFYTYISLGYSSPVSRIYNSILTPDTRPLHLKYYNKAPGPQVSHDHGNTRYLWDITEVPLIKMDDGTPTGYDPYPGASVSEYDTWLQVKEWAKRVYGPALTGTSPEIDKLVKEIEIEHPDDDGRTIAAVTYVQDKIRYFGVETGINTHKPNLPASTIKLGYGDCKDKSMLLCCMLRAMNITAHPVLIQANTPSIIEGHLPSAVIFNHVCVQAIVHGTKFYFDATEPSQHADLTHYHFPRYRYGLVVTDESTDITRIPYSDNGAKTILHARIEADDSTVPAKLIVTTTYYAVYASHFRYLWNNKSHEEIEKSYLNFYAREYPGIESIQDLKITDEDDRVNMVQTEETYIIRNFWTRNKAGDMTREIFAYNLQSLVNKPKDKKRTMPIGISYPEHYIEEYDMVLPFSLTPTDKTKMISNDAFEYTAAVSFSKKDKTLHLKYTYDTKQDRIPADQAASYFADVKKLDQDIGYSITWYTHEKAAIGGFSLFIFLIFLVTLALSVWLVYRIYTGYDPEPAALLAGDEGRSIGGWLIIPAINITLMPLICIIVIMTGHYFSDSAIDMIFNKSAENYNPALGYLAILEMCFKVILATWSVLIFVLFYQKRTSLPRLYIYFMLFTFFQQFAIKLGLFFMKMDDTGFLSNIEVLIYVIIWSLYMIYSVRVKETFTRMRKERSPSLPSDSDTDTVSAQSEEQEDHTAYMPGQS